MAWCRQRNLILIGLLAVAGCQSEQPRSSLQYRAPVLVDWIWSGALRTDGLILKAKPSRGVDPTRLRLRIGRRPDLSSPVEFGPGRLTADVVTFEISKLEPGTRYYYAAAAGDVVDEIRRGTFRTLPLDASFTIAFGACARTASTAAVFDTIRRLAPLFFVHLGDFHYESLATADPADYRRVYDHVLASPAQSALYRQIPIVYAWDDHDYGPDNADSRHPGRGAVRQVYQRVVPHYQLAAGSGDVPIYHSFEVGRVRFVVTDTRSERSPREAPDGPAKTLLGEAQKEWLKAELSRDRDRYPLVVWINPVPWIAPREAGADHWGGYGHERRELADFLVARSLSGVAMLSGDAHMLAIDDGSHSNFSSDSKGGFPVFHSAALDRPGSAKGGPYSHGSVPGGGHVGLMEVEDRGSEIVVLWKGLDWQGEILLEHRFAVPAGEAP